MDVSCDSREYFEWLFLFGLPSYLLLACVIPGFLLFLILRNTEKINEGEVLALQTYGPLTLGFEPYLKYWPVVEIVRSWP